MQITNIAQAKKNSDRVNVFVDEEFSFSLDKNQLIDSAIYKGQKVSPARLAELKKLSFDGKLYDRMIKFLSMRPRSIKEFQEYLLYKIKLGEEDSDSIIHDMKRSGYLDDHKFATWWLQSRLNFKNYGLRKIKFELNSKGISSDIMEEAIRSEDTAEMAKALIAKAQKLADKYKYRHKGLSEFEFKQKLTQYLSSKGFDFEIIKKVV